MSGQFPIPILMVIFNRPETTGRVFAEVRKVKPARLFVAADGPREGRPGERELCERTRAIVDQVDWDCEVRTLFREKNLGCSLAVSTAIDWFFESVDRGIILEDDCLPDPSFFPYCHELLDRYGDDERVMMVAGTNFLGDRSTGLNESYYFSKYYAIWGWATWKRAWRLYDRKMAGWPDYRASGQLSWAYPDTAIARHFDFIFQQAYTGEVDTWDYQWVYSCVFQNGLAAVPRCNLISNIGGEGAHCQDDRFMALPFGSLDTGHLVHPKNVVSNAFLDRQCFRIILNSSPRTMLADIARFVRHRIRDGP